jgi:hypothetical protein
MIFFCPLKLRDDPLVRPHWPPCWKPFYGSRTPATGEVGTLDDIRVSHVTKMSCLLLIVHQGTDYIGVITFEDDGFCRRFVDALQQHRGKPIVQIAELDIP